MYKQAFIYSLKNIAKDKSNSGISIPGLGRSSGKYKDNRKSEVDTFTPAPYDIKEILRMEPIELSPSTNEAAYALRNAMSRGSGANLNLTAFKTHDLSSATDAANFVKYNPENTPIAMHEYGHVIDKPNFLHKFGLDVLHPALGSAWQYRQELDANRKGLEAFRKGMAHNKELGDEMARTHDIIRDKALATYRSALKPKAIGGIGGSVLGGIAGYYTAPEDAGIINKSLRTLGGAWVGGQLGGFAGSIASIPGNARASNDVLRTLYSKEYTDAVSNLNRKLIADARANNYYRPNVVAGNA